MRFFFVGLLVCYYKVGKWRSEIKIKRCGQAQKERRVFLALRR